MRLALVLLLIILVGLIIVLISSFIDNRTIKVKTYSVETDLVKKDCKLVFISDLHGNTFGENNCRLIDAIRKVDPDILVYGGDMITARVEKINTQNWKNAFNLMDELKNYPCFYGLGNHEYRMDLYRENFNDAYDQLIEIINSKNIKMLNNSSIYVEEYGIDIKGLSIDKRFYKRFEKHKMDTEYLESCIGNKKKDAYTIMLAHNPEYFNEYSKVADMTLSGHVHGGIMKLPVLGGVISPRLTLFPKYDGGLFAQNSSVMIISRGLGSHTLPFRVFNPCELVVIDIKKTK